MSLYKKQNVIRGILIYAIGDSIAAIILGHFLISRLLGMMMIGGGIYALEIPHYFDWIDRHTATIPATAKRAFAKTAFALIYFNPLWIARHLVLIMLFSGQLSAISPHVLKLGFCSWLGNIPLSILGNYIIQVKIPLKARFTASALFSGCMAVYYALSESLFP